MSYIFEYLTDDGQWSAEHCGQQDSSNAIEDYETALGEIPELARVLDIEDLARIRVVEYVGRR